MTATSARDITMDNRQLSRAMTMTTPAPNRDDNDIFEFGRVYLPNMFAQWAEELRAMYGTQFNLTTASTVTVAHSRNPNNLLFNSSLIGADRNPETKFVDTFHGPAIATHQQHGRFFWFQPLGTMSVPRPEARITAGAGLPDQTAPNPQEVAGQPRLGTDGHQYFWSGSTAATGHWFKFDYENLNYRNGRYDRGRLENQSISPDGIYTVTYSITFGGITSSVEFRIGMGDTATPTVMFVNDATEERLVGGSYRLNQDFRFNTRDIIVNANGGRRTAQDNQGLFEEWIVARNLTITVQRPGGLTNIDINTDDSAAGTGNRELIHRNPIHNSGLRNYRVATGGETSDDFGFLLDDGDRVLEGTATRSDRDWHFRLTESGDYTIIFQITSASGRTGIMTRIITVDPPRARTSVSPETIWGTILIVLSSGLLLGIAVYFFYTGRKTKFVGSAKAAAAPAGGDKKQSSIGKRLKEKLSLNKKDKPKESIDIKPEA